MTPHPIQPPPDDPNILDEPPPGYLGDPPDTSGAVWAGELDDPPAEGSTYIELDDPPAEGSTYIELDDPPAEPHGEGSLSRHQRGNLEEERLQGVIDKEVVPETGADSVDRTDPTHVRNVLDVIEWALWSTESRDAAGEVIGTRQENLESARVAVKNLRDASTHNNSTSLILRDAERYLWARAGVGQFSTGNVPEWATRFLAPAASGIYDVGKYFDLKLGTDYARATERPYSPRGGDPWFFLGLSHWDSYDKSHLLENVTPYRPTANDMLRFLEADAARHLPSDFIRSMQGRGVFLPQPPKI